MNAEDREDKDSCPALVGHYWVISPAQGHYSWGICKRCGDTRRFANSLTHPRLWMHPRGEEDA
jgi:hypothetical protein